MKPSGPAADQVSQGQPAARREHRRRVVRWRWTVAITIAVLFHGVLLALTRIQLSPHVRSDRINPRSTWVGEKVFREEGTMRGQVVAIFNDAPLFLPTSLNYASRRRPVEDARPPGEIFSSFDPRLAMPVDRSPPGLVVSPTDPELPIAAVVQTFQWPYLSRFGRHDPEVVVLDQRIARLEVRAMGKDALLFATSLPVESGQDEPDGWPDWRPFDLFLTMSETGRMSEPTVLGRGSTSAQVDRFMRDYIRNRMRLDLRLGPGSYRIAIGP